MNQATARATLVEMLEPTEEPTLTDAEIDDLLVFGQRADIFGNLPYLPWRAASLYNAADYTVPAPRNGHLYQVQVAGTSAATQPAFPTASGGTIVDGTVTWVEVGSNPWTPTYDLNAAAAEGWRRKASKVATSAYSYSLNRQLVDRTQVYDHCLQQAKEYAAKVTVAVPVGTWGVQPIEPPWWF